MPLYEYKCASCGDVFEVIQKFSDEPLTVHQGCGGSLERLVSAAALSFKGSGWYVTDYGKNGSTGTESKSKSKSESSDTAKSDSSASSTPATKDSTPTAKSE